MEARYRQRRTYQAHYENSSVSVRQLDLSSCFERQPLDEFARWVAPRRPLEWVLSMLQYLPMSTTAREELLWRFARTGDPEIDARQDRILEVLLTANPKMKQRLVDEGRLEGRLDEARAALRRVLAHRQLALTPEDAARIEACTELTTLEQWHAQALTASSAQQALR
ncbi:hypothetical protein WME97_08400 [Sorangium sp. So ce367]|uniref:hypothetical protein n=1 Tax=Sorangium sp. So ce367 TaxID=3133305 RepID=UPI003F642E6E